MLYTRGISLCISFATGIAIATNISGERMYQKMILRSLAPKMKIGIFLIMFKIGI